jgi:hypothetical protein
VEHDWKQLDMATATSAAWNEAIFTNLTGVDTCRFPSERSGSKLSSPSVIGRAKGLDMHRGYGATDPGRRGKHEIIC